jgi:hypothetical protein
VELAVELGRVGEGSVLSHCDNVVVVGGERWVWVFVKGRRDETRLVLRQGGDPQAYILVWDNDVSASAAVLRLSDANRVRRSEAFHEQYCLI